MRRMRRRRNGNWSGSGNDRVRTRCNDTCTCGRIPLGGGTNLLRIRGAAYRNNACEREGTQENPTAAGDACRVGMRDGSHAQEEERVRNTLGRDEVRQQLALLKQMLGAKRVLVVEAYQCRRGSAKQDERHGGAVTKQHGDDEELCWQRSRQ